MIKHNGDRYLFFAYSFDFLNHFLPSCGRSNKTIESYRDTLTVFKNWIAKVKGIGITDFTFKAFTSDIVFDFLNWLGEYRGNSDSTRNQRLAGLKIYIDYCVYRDVSLSSLKIMLNGVKPYKTEKRIKETLTPNQVILIINECAKNIKGRRDELILRMLYETAIRVSELVNITTENLFLLTDSPYLLIKGKGKKERTIPLIGELPRILSDYVRNVSTPASSSYIFFTIHDSKPCRISVRAVQEMIDRCASKAREKDSSIPENVYPHMFRRTKATVLYQNGMKLEQISSLLGHSKLETTRVYAKASVDQIRASMEKAIPEEDIKQIPIWQGKTEDFSKMFGLR